MGPVVPSPPSELSGGKRRNAGAQGERPLATVIKLAQGSGAPTQRATPLLEAVAVLVAIALGLSPLWSGYYDFGLWAPLALAAVVLLVVAALGERPAFTRYGVSAGGALAVLLSLSAASMLWAESKENAWTDSNQLALYAVIFAIGLLAIRERRSARTVALVLGAPALLASVVIVARMLTGDGQGMFLAGRLNSPLGYINGTAGLLAMGIWPWIALAESAPRRIVRAGALAGTALIAGTAVLTQSRAIVPAIVLASILVLLAAPSRTRRTLHLVVIGVAVGVGLHWTLEVYSSSGPTQSLPLTNAVLRNAGLAIIAGALLAGAARLALSAISARVTPKPRELILRRLGQALLVASVVIVAAGLVAGHSTISKQYKAFVNNYPDQAAPDRFLDAGGYRYDLWRVAVHEFTSHPVGGLGAGNYDTDYYLLRRTPQAVVVPHSLELQMAAELGIGGLLALLIFCGAILSAGFARRRTLASTDPFIRIAALGVFTAWLTGTSVDWLYNFPGLTGAALLAAALLVVPARAAGASTLPAASVSGGAAAAETIERRSRSGQAMLVVTLAALALIAASVGRQYAASRYQASGAAKTQTQPVAAIRTLQTAEQLDPYSLQTLYDIASAYASLDDYNDARAALLAALRREPDNYVTSALLGDLATRRGYYRVALADYSRAERLDPDDAEVQSLVLSARAQLTAAESGR
jgi:O-antigen ligase